MPPLPAGALPQPISAELDAALSQTLAAIPSGKTKRLTFGLSQAGAEVGVGWRVGSTGTVSAYAADQWGAGWAAGLKGAFAW